jgi:hypothetical protein
MKPYLGGNPPNRDFLTLAILFHLVCILTFYFSVKLAISDAGLVAIDAVERTGGNPYEAIIAAPFKGCNSWEVATELDRLLNECQRFRNKSAYRFFTPSEIQSTERSYSADADIFAIQPRKLIRSVAIRLLLTALTIDDFSSIQVPDCNA